MTWMGMVDVEGLAEGDAGLVDGSEAAEEKTGVAVGVSPDVTDCVGVAVGVRPVVTEGVRVGVGGAGDAVAVTGDAAHDQPAFVKAGGREHTLRLSRARNATASIEYCD